MGRNYAKLMRRESDLTRHRQKIAMTIITVFTLTLVAILAGERVLVSAGQNREFIITATQYEYNPSVIRVSLGDQVTIRLRSADVSHGLYLDGYEYNLKLKLEEEGGQWGVEAKKPYEAVVSFVANKPGTFRFRCSVTCGPYHPFMMGYFMVEPNYQFPISITLSVLVVVATSVYMWKKW